MKLVAVETMPPCDLAVAADQEHGVGEYNTPTRRDDPLTGGRWANLCAECFEEHGIDTSVTELRVRTPEEVAAIARHFGGETAVPRPVRPGTWRFGSVENGFFSDFVYEVSRPGVEVSVYEDSGRPAGQVVRDDWVVRCLNDAPDAWFTVSRAGVKQGYAGEEKIW